MKSSSWEAARAGAEWLLATRETPGLDLRAYYKTASALLASGHPREAHAVLDVVEGGLLQSGGDLDGEGVPWYGTYRTYPHSWLCCAAAQAGRFSLARALSGFIAGYHDHSTGGFFADEARTTQETMTTAMAALACLWSGEHRGLALASGRWFERLIAAQPDWRRGFHTSWPLTGAHFVDAQKPGQWYFQYGISAAFLSALAGATGEDRWMTLARKLVDASAHCHEDRHSTPQSGKLGWGAAWVGNREIAEAVSRGLRRLQNGDGSWLATGVYGGERAEADSVTVDVTAEFVALLGYMACPEVGSEG